MATVKDFLLVIVTFVFPIIAIGLSVLSYVDSRKANKLQERLMQVENKLKKYELEDKEKEREEATKACVEARIIRISSRNYKMKIFNSGKARAYNVDFQVPEECSEFIVRDKVPFEFLDPGKNFEELVFVYDGFPDKFKLITTWTDRNNEPCSKDQIVSI